MVYISGGLYVASRLLSQITEASAVREWSIIEIFSHTNMIARHRVRRDGVEADVGASWEKDCEKASAMKARRKVG